MPSAIVLGLFAVVILVAVVAIDRWLRFRNWPPRAWKDRLERQIAEWGRTIAEQDNHPDAKREQSLREQRLQRYLDSIPLSRLANYPGIGQGTVQKLEEARFTKVSQIGQLGWTSQVPGIGEVRQKSLKEAAKAIKIDGETKFECGQCDEGRAWIAERDRMREGHRAESDKRDRIKAAAKRAIDQAQPLVDLARTVTFPAFLFHSHSCPVTDEVMNRPFPTMVIDEVKSGPVSVPPVEAKPADRPAADAREPAGPAENKDLERLRIYTRFAFVIARADGRVTVAEKKEIRTFLYEQFEGDTRLARHIDAIIEQCENPPPVEADVIAELREITNHDQQGVLLSAARRIADCSGDRNQKEQIVIDRIATAFGLSGSSATPSSAATVPPATDDRTVLGIPADAKLTSELVRRRFNILTDQFDPAKAAGLGEEFVAMAAGKRDAVKSSAERLMAQLGEPLIPPAAPPPPPPPSDIRYNPDLDAIFGS
jgi:tellurite resistance protein